MRFWHSAWQIYAKDMRIQFRQKSLFLSMVVFAVLLQVMLSFAMDGNVQRLQELGAGVLWLPILLTSFIGVARFQSLEEAGGHWDGLRVAPIEQGAVFLAKAWGAMTLVLLVEAITVPLHFVLFSQPQPLSWPLLLATLALGSWGYVAMATFLAVMSSASRLGDLLLPILLLPLSVPVILGVIQLTERALVPTLPGQEVLWMSILIAYDILFTVLPAILFSYIWEV